MILYSVLYNSSYHECSSWFVSGIVINMHKSLSISWCVQIRLPSSPSTTSRISKYGWQILWWSWLLWLFWKCLVTLIFNKIVLLPFIFRFHEWCRSKSSSLHVVKTYWSCASFCQDLNMMEILIHFLTVQNLFELLSFIIFISK